MAARQELKSVVQKFEGILWNQVAQSMNRVTFGPDTLGAGGHMMQRMMWRRVTQNFGGVSPQLTRATLSQLSPTALSTPPAVSNKKTLSSFGVSNTDSGIQESSPRNDQGWVQAVWDTIKAGAEALGVPVKALLAQAALETGWGQNSDGNNLFGVKAHQSGDHFTALTHEFKGGALRQVYASFQRYPDLEDSMADYVDTIRTLYPEAVGQPTIAGYAQSLQKGGYATDPRYAAKIVAVADSAHMKELLQEVN